MGLNLKWIAMKGGRDKLLDHLGYAPIGECSDDVTPNYACCDFPDGWVVFAATGYNYAIEEAVKDLPAGSLVLAAESYESVTFSSLRAYQNGAEVWSVIHDPDKQQYGVLVEGQPPAPFAELRRELEAIQAEEEERVDHILDLTGRLGKSLCGYDPGRRDGLVWTVLGGNGPSPQHARRSVVEAIRTELVPYLRSLGWEAQKDASNVSSSENILRHVDGQVQTIFFRFMSGPQTYIQVIFETRGKRPSGLSHPVRGEIACEAVLPRPGKWQGFFKPRLPAPDPIDEAIERAKADILAAEAFLKTDEPKPNIRLYRGADPEGGEAD